MGQLNSPLLPPLPPPPHLHDCHHSIQSPSSNSDSSSESEYSTAMRRDRMVATSLPTRSCLASCSRCSSTFRSCMPAVRRSNNRQGKLHITAYRSIILLFYSFNIHYGRQILSENIIKQERIRIIRESYLKSVKTQPTFSDSFQQNTACVADRWQTGWMVPFGYHIVDSVGQWGGHGSC